MAEYTLATQKAGNPGITGGLSPSMLKGGSTRIAAPQLQQNAASIEYMPAPIPQAVEDKTSQGVQHFLESTAEAAFRYQERESEYLAKTLVDRYQRLAFDAYSGTTDPDGNFIPGYSSKSGASAIAGYNEYTQSLDENFYGLLKSVDPRVQQKAIFEMNTIKNSMRNKAAAHRVKEQQKLDDQNDFRDLQRWTEQAQFNPEDIFTPDQTGLNLLEKMRTKFDSDEEFQDWWGPTIKDMSENVYYTTYQDSLNSGLDPATSEIKALRELQKFSENVARPTLFNDPGTTNDILGFVKRAKINADSAALTVAELKEKKDKAAHEQRKLDQQHYWLKRQADYLANPSDMANTPPSLNEIIIGSPDLNFNEISTIAKTFLNTDTIRGDPEKEMALLATAARGELTPEIMAENRRWVSDKVMEQARARQLATEDDVQGDEFSKIFNHIDSIFGVTPFSVSFSKPFTDPTFITGIKGDAELEGKQCIRAGNGLEYCKRKLTLKYEQGTEEDGVYSYYGNDEIVMPDGDRYRIDNRQQYETMYDRIMEEENLLRQELSSYAEPPYPVDLMNRIATNETRFKQLDRWLVWLKLDAEFKANGQ